MFIKAQVTFKGLLLVMPPLSCLSFRHVWANAFFSPPAAPTSCMPTLHTVDQTCVYLRGERRRGRRTATKRSLCSSRTKRRRRMWRMTRRKRCSRGTAAQGTTGRWEGSFQSPGGADNRKQTKCSRNKSLIRTSSSRCSRTNWLDVFCFVFNASMFFVADGVDGGERGQADPRRRQGPWRTP